MWEAILAASLVTGRRARSAPRSRDLKSAEAVWTRLDLRHGESIWASVQAMQAT
jgi:hypothetical protein